MAARTGTAELTVAVLVRRVVSGFDLPEDHPEPDALQRRLDAWLAPTRDRADTDVPVSAADEAWVAEGFALLKEYGQGGR